MCNTNSVLKDDLREILNSSNKRCTTVYKQSFSCEINCTKVKQTVTKLHKSPDETDRARSRRLLQNERLRLRLHMALGGILESTLWTQDQQFRLVGLLPVCLSVCVRQTCLSWRRPHMTSDAVAYRITITMIKARSCATRARCRVPSAWLQQVSVSAPTSITRTPMFGLSTGSRRSAGRKIIMPM